MAQNEPNKSSGGGGGNQPPKRARGKSIFDGTNIAGAFLWLSSALLTAIVFMLVFISVPCAGSRGEVLGTCLTGVLTSQAGIYTLIGAVLVQFLVSIMIHRLRTPAWVRIGNAIEWLINFIGFFWLICVELGVAPGVYAQVITFVKNLTVPTIIWWLVLIALSVGLDMLTNNLFNAPPSGGGNVPPRR